MNSKFCKILCSMPIIFLALYYIPIVGICLIILRYFATNTRKRNLTPIILISVGILLFIPKILYNILNMIEYEISTIPYLKEIINQDIYNINLLNYSKMLITIGIITLIITYALRNVLSKISNLISRYMRKSMEADYKISKENDMKIKQQREKARNTTFIRCSNCGAQNIVSGKIGTCSHCRSKLVNENYKQ